MSAPVIALMSTIKRPPSQREESDNFTSALGNLMRAGDPMGHALMVRRETISSTAVSTFGGFAAATAGVVGTVMAGTAVLPAVAIVGGAAAIGAVAGKRLWTPEVAEQAAIGDVRRILAASRTRACSFTDVDIAKNNFLRGDMEDWRKKRDSVCKAPLRDNGPATRM